MLDSSVAATTASVRDGLRRAAANQRRAVAMSRPWDQPADIGTILGHLSATVTAMDRLLDDLVRGLLDSTVSETIESVDGPFRDDLPSAVATAQLWISCANAACGKLRDSIDNAHIAVSGLARSPRETGQT
jgi:hypothetical protein